MAATGTGRHSKSATEQEEEMKLRLTVANQKGGVGKTTSVLTMARCFADQGLRVLMVDTDPQGNLWVTLKDHFPDGDKPPYWIHQLFSDEPVAATVMAVKVHDRISCIFSDRRMFFAESRLAATTAKELILSSLFSVVEQQYDVVLFDVAPSISHIQTCAVAYTRNVLIPVAMDNLSVEGALSSLQTVDLLNHHLKLDCRCIGFLPTQIDMRLSATEVIMHSLQERSAGMGIPLLPGIRTDQAVNRSLRAGKFLQDFDPRSKALEDYEKTCALLMTASAVAA
jgi:chromosome partitioning protein